MIKVNFVLKPVLFSFLNLFEYRGAISPRMKNRRKNKLVKPVGREYRGLLALGSLFLAFLIFNLYWKDLKTHVFHIDEYSFLRKSYFFDKFFIKKDLDDKSWQKDDFNQPKLGLYIYGLALHLRGIKNIESFQKEIKFNEIKINDKSWWYEFSFKKFENIPESLNPARELIYKGRKTSVVFSFGVFLLAFVFTKLFKKPFFSFITVVLLANNNLMWYYGRMAMTDSFQLFFFFINLISVYFYLQSFWRKQNRRFIFLSFIIGINSALASGVKVIGILALCFFIGTFAFIFFHNFKTRLFDKTTLFASFLIVVSVFFFLFVFLNPQIYNQPFKGFYKMFTSRWQGAENYRLIEGRPVFSQKEALILVFKRLLKPGNFGGNFGSVSVIPLDLIFLFSGLCLLFNRIRLGHKKAKDISLEFLLLFWFMVVFISLVFYLKNDWLRYYLPLGSAITLIQSYFLAWLLEKTIKNDKIPFN